MFNANKTDRLLIKAYQTTSRKAPDISKLHFHYRSCKVIVFIFFTILLVKSIKRCQRNPENIDDSNIPLDKIKSFIKEPPASPSLQKQIVLLELLPLPYFLSSPPLRPIIVADAWTGRTRRGIKRHHHHLTPFTSSHINTWDPRNWSRKSK